MRLSKIVLAGAATVALSLSLGACSLSVNGAGSADSASPEASQAQNPDTGSTGAQGSTGTGSAGGSASATTGSTGSNNSTGSGDHDGDDDDADDAPITNAAWKEILDKGERQTVSGSHAVQGAGSTLNLVGDLDTLTVQGAETKIAAEDIDTLIIQGSDVTVYARDIDNLQIQGANVTVHWLGDDPVIQDMGVGSTTGKLTQ